jgi:hypothetical protein
MHPYYATLTKVSCPTLTTSPLAYRPHNMSRVRMRGVLFPRPPSASSPFTVIQFFVYLRADVTTSGQLQRRHRYTNGQQTTVTRGERGHTEGQTLRLTSVCDTLLCLGSIKYKICANQNTATFRQDSLCVSKCDMLRHMIGHGSFRSPRQF